MFFDEVEPRVCLLSVLGISWSVVFSSTLPSLGIGAGFVLICLILARLPLRIILYRLGMIQMVLGLILITVPVTVEGVPLIEVAGVTVSQEGLGMAALILVKSVLITGVTLALLGRWNGTILTKVLLGLWIPSRLGLLVTLLVRSISVLTADLHRIYIALQARGFEITASLYTLSRVGLIVGALMTRAVWRAQATMMALHCRGVGMTKDSRWHWSIQSLGFTFLTIGCSAGMLWSEIT